MTVDDVRAAGETLHEALGGGNGEAEFVARTVIRSLQEELDWIEHASDEVDCGEWWRHLSNSATANRELEMELVFPED